MSNKEVSLDDVEVNAPSRDDLNLPEDPGPAILGKTPVVGSLRRRNDMTVIRDEIKRQVD